MLVRHPGKRMKTVFVSGSFDMLHSGHIYFLEEAAKFGLLHVGIGSDYSIKKYKAKSPVCSELERLFMLKRLRSVYDAWVNSGEGPYDFVTEFENGWVPDMMVVNKDQDSEQKRFICKHFNIDYKVIDSRGSFIKMGFPHRSTTEYRKQW